jgi:hypothetical protein
VITPWLEFIFTAEAKLADPIQIGQTYEGQRRIIPILEGTFDGPTLRGTFVSAGAADWQHTRHDGVTQADAIYALQTDDGVILQVENFGLRHGPPDVIKRLFAGEDVDPAEYYFRTTPRFKAPAGKYDWMSKTLFVASGARYRNGIKLWFFAVR